MATRRFDFTFPRRPDGRFTVQIIEQKPREDGTFEWDMYPLKDAATGETRSFAAPSDAWDAAKAWERAQQQAGG